MDITSVGAVHFLQKAEAVASSKSILRSNTAIQVITGGPRHKFHCNGAQTHREEKRADNTHAFRVRMQSASRSLLTSAKTRQKRVPRVPFMRYLSNEHAPYRAHTRPTGRRGRARLPFDAGRDRPTTLAGYRESTTQIMMSKVDRTNALYYIVNAPKTRAKAPVPNVAPTSEIPYPSIQ